MILDIILGVHLFGVLVGIHCLFLEALSENS